MKFHTVLAAAVIATALASTPALTQDSKRDELVIGVSQFPQGFHPNLASHVVLSLINGMTRRPFTVYDADWKLICMLCETLPSRAAGTIRDWTTPEGEPGLEVDYTIRAGATWGDGTPVSTEDVKFTWAIGRDETAGINNQELYRRMEKIVAHDDSRFTIFWNKRTCNAEAINDFELVPAHLEAEAASERSQPISMFAKVGPEEIGQCLLSAGCQTPEQGHLHQPKQGIVFGEDDVEIVWHGHSVTPGEFGHHLYP